MTHHWRPSDHLERAPGRSEWLLVHRGIQIGRVEYGRVAQRPAFRSMAGGADGRYVGAVIGYSWALETACDRLWDWSVRVRHAGRLPDRSPTDQPEKATTGMAAATSTTAGGSGASAWPWPPIRISETEWVIMRNSAHRPKAVVRRMEADPGHPPFYRAVSWAPASVDRRLIGYFPTLETADLSILEDAPGLITHGPDKDRLGTRAF